MLRRLHVVSVDAAVIRRGGASLRLQRAERGLRRASRAAGGQRRHGQSRPPRAIVRELPGRIAPLRVAEVRPRVSGIIVGRSFQQGSQVKAGDALYQIDPKPFEVELQATEAALAKAEAVKEQAAQHARRIGILASGQAASQASKRKPRSRRCARPRPISPRARPMSRARGSISATPPSARRSAASSAPRC